MIGATVRQREVLRFIRTFQRKHGYTPSFREIADGVGLASTSTVSEHISALVRKGYLVKIAHLVRALGVTKDGNALLDAGIIAEELSHA